MISHEAEYGAVAQSLSLAEKMRLRQLVDEANQAFRKATTMDAS